MSIVHYPAIIEREAEGGFSVSFPDLPGCFTCGDTIFEAVRMAEDALSGHLLAMHDRRVFPSGPTPLESVQVEEGIDVATIQLIRGELPGRAIRIQVTMDEGLVAKIDRIASNRSRFLADAARAVLAD